MPVTDIISDAETRTMTLTADFAASVERVWEAFTTPAQLERFWGPPGWPATFTRFDFTVGGIVNYHMTSPQGEGSYGCWEVLAIDEPRRFEVLDAFTDADGTVFEGFPAMRMEFRFEASDAGTRFTNTTYFDSVEALEQVIEMGAVEGSRMAMNQLDLVLQGLRDFAQGKGTQLEEVDDTHVRITRLVEGPRELVWRAYNEPDLVRQWMLGPDGWEMTDCELPAAVGERSKLSWRDTSGAQPSFGFEGEALVIDEPRRMVATERMAGTEGPTNINDMTFDEEDGATLVTVYIEFEDKDTRDMILATGMAEGMEQSYARLEGVLAGMR